MKSGMQFFGFSVSKSEWPAFRAELVKRDLYFEPSEAYDHVHVEVRCTPEEAHELDVMDLNPVDDIIQADTDIEFKFNSLDNRKYYELYSNLFHIITDGMNADLKNNIKEAFKLVGGRASVQVLSDNYIKYDGSVGSDYTIGGSIMLGHLEYDARRLAEDLTMAYFKTTEGKDIPCNTYEFMDWVKGEPITSATEIGNHLSGFKFDFIVVYNYSDSIWDIIENIVETVFNDNGCEVTGFDMDSVDYSDIPEYKEFDVIQAGVDFTWIEEYDSYAIEQQLRTAMKNAGYQVIGNPDFYSIEEWGWN